MRLSLYALAVLLAGGLASWLASPSIAAIFSDESHLLYHEKCAVSDLIPTLDRRLVEQHALLLSIHCDSYFAIDVWECKAQIQDIYQW